MTREPNLTAEDQPEAMRPEAPEMLEGVTTFPFTKIIGAEHIRFGRPVVIDDFVFIYAADEHFIGSYVHIAAFTSISGGGKLFMDDFSGLASGCRILTGSEDFLGAGLTNPTIPEPFRAVRRGQVTIEKHVIVGANAVVLPDVTIGEGCAIGAGSVVTKSLAPWGVYAGVPARRLRDRPKREILARAAQLRDLMSAKE